MAGERDGGERTGSAPFGYALGADGVSLEEDAQEQRIIHLVEALRSEGISTRAIAARLRGGASAETPKGEVGPPTDHPVDWGATRERIRHIDARALRALRKPRSRRRARSTGDDRRREPDTAKVVDLARARRVQDAFRELEGAVSRRAARERVTAWLLSLGGDGSVRLVDGVKTVRVPVELSRRAERLVGAMAADAEARVLMGRPKAAAVLRVAALEGLKGLEKRYRVEHDEE